MLLNLTKTLKITVFIVKNILGGKRPINLMILLYKEIIKVIYNLKKNNLMIF